MNSGFPIRVLQGNIKVEKYVPVAMPATIEMNYDGQSLSIHHQQPQSGIGLCARRVARIPEWRHHAECPLKLGDRSVRGNWKFRSATVTSDPSGFGGGNNASTPMYQTCSSS
jgi:hypothetical protein